MKAVTIFLSYAQKDKLFMESLNKHLSVLRHSKLITVWHDRQIQEGIDWQQEIDVHLESANIILPLVSTDFLLSDYCDGAEMKRALERHNAGEAYVIPILVRPVDWQATPLKALEVLPTNAKPVTSWSDRDAAFFNVAEGIRKVIAKISQPTLSKDLSSLTQVQDLANLLTVRKNNNRSTVLLLGSRAGKLFRSTDFYKNLQHFSIRSFYQLSRLEQFRECFHILTNNKFSETDIHSILSVSLRNTNNVDADIALAMLIKDGFFHEIITTNIDDGLEDALLTVNMKEGRDYEVIRSSTKTVRTENYLPYRITKVFGDLLTKDYTLEHSSYLDNNQDLRYFLQSMLSKDVLAIGIDPVWDKEMLRIIPIKGNALWFMTEEEIHDNLIVNAILAGRKATSIIGSEGQYDYFINLLYKCLYGNIPLNYPAINSQAQNIQDPIDEQLKNLTSLLSGITDRLQSLQNDNLTFFSEIQEIRNKLEAIEKKQLQDNERISQQNDFPPPTTHPEYGQQHPI